MYTRRIVDERAPATQPGIVQHTAKATWEDLQTSTNRRCFSTYCILRLNRCRKRTDPSLLTICYIARRSPLLPVAPRNTAFPTWCS